MRPFPFSLRQLQYAVTVGEARGFRRAAELCAVSQPSLSAQIAELEGVLGFPLFERDHRRVLVTPAGADFLIHARAVLARADEALDAAARQRDPLASPVRLGVIPTVAPYLLPSALPALKQAMPTLQPRFSEEPTTSLLKQLDVGLVDGVIVAGHEGLDAHDSVGLGFDPFCLVVARDHPLAGRDVVDFDDLAGEALLLLDEGHCLRDQVLVWCSRLGDSDVRATSLSTLVQLVAAGAGVTLLPGIATAAEAQRADIVLVPLTQPSPGRTLRLAWRKGSPLTTTMQAIAAVLQRCVRPD